MKELTLVTIQSQLAGSQKLLVDEGTVEEINRLATEPDYGPEFLESYLDHLNVLAESPRNNHTQYLAAIKFFSLVESGNSLTDAFIKVFPERYEARKAGHPNPDSGKEIVRGDASRYNGSRLVSEVRRVATVPVQLIHRHLLHEAILHNAKLMVGARSEMVQQKAADTLIRELKPQEDSTLKIEVDDGSTSVIAELAAATEALAAQQYKAAHAGVPMKQIASAKIFRSEDETIDGDFTPVDPPEPEIETMVEQIDAIEGIAEPTHESTIPRASTEWKLK
jgi:hypothetical protein